MASAADGGPTLQALLIPAAQWPPFVVEDVSSRSPKVTKPGLRPGPGVRSYQCGPGSDLLIVAWPPSWLLLQFCYCSKEKEEEEEERGEAAH
eukprot:746077-Hanusia_phi.AAC.1